MTVRVSATAPSNVNSMSALALVSVATTTEMVAERPSLGCVKDVFPSETSGGSVEKVPFSAVAAASSAPCTVAVQAYVVSSARPSNSSERGPFCAAVAFLVTPFTVTATSALALVPRSTVAVNVTFVRPGVAATLIVAGITAAGTPSLKTHIFMSSPFPLSRRSER